MPVPSMDNAQTYRFDYLRRHDHGFFLGLKGPRGGIHAISLARDDLTRLIGAYMRECGVPPRGERAASLQAAVEQMRHTLERRPGGWGAQARGWWEREASEAPPVGEWHQIIRLGDATAVVVPVEAYRRLREVAYRVSPDAVAGTDVVQAPTVGHVIG